MPVAASAHSGRGISEEKKVRALALVGNIGRIVGKPELQLFTRMKCQCVKILANLKKLPYKAGWVRTPLPYKVNLNDHVLSPARGDRASEFTISHDGNLWNPKVKEGARAVIRKM